MGIHRGIFNFLLGGDSHGQHGTVLDALHFYPGNGGSFPGGMKFPFYHQKWLALLEQAAPLGYISASYHRILASAHIIFHTIIVIY
jgi:hypothetical protein